MTLNFQDLRLVFVLQILITKNFEDLIFITFSFFFQLLPSEFCLKFVLLNVELKLVELYIQKGKSF